MQNKEKFNYDILDKVANSGKESGGCGDRRAATCILHLFVVYSNKVNSTCSPPAGSPAGFAVSSLPPRGRYMTHGPPAREGSN